MDSTADFYSRPSHDFRGGGFPVFSGSRRQRGGGIFGRIKSFFMPVVKRLGKNLLSQGVSLASDVVGDAMLGKNVKSSFINHGKRRAMEFGKNAASEGVSALSNMIGKGGRRSPRKRLRRKTVGKRKRKAKRRPISRKPAASRKRQARSKPARKRKPKRRRIAANF